MPHPTPPRSTDLPQRWGRYELQRVLGQGGAARVYQAELVGPAGFRKPVALKLMLGDEGQREAQRLEEARLGVRLNHPNIVRTFELGQHDGVMFIAMELIEGPTALQLMRGHALPPHAALDLGAQVAEGLAHAGSLRVGYSADRVVHRDIKPANLLVDGSGRVRIADFGIAMVAERRPHQGPGGGTPGYVAPEQQRGGVTDPRADLFSLGVVVLEAALGQHPWRELEPEQMFQELLKPADALHARGLYAPLESVAPGLADLLAGCLHSNVHRRTHNAGALALQLARLRDAMPAQGTLSELVRGRPSPKAQPAPPTQTPTPDVSIHIERSTARTTRRPELKPLVGRRLVQQEVEQALTDAKAVQLLGPGGMGKTALATNILNTAGQRAGARVAWCELFEVSTPQDLSLRLARALDRPLMDGGSTDRQLQALGHALAGRGPLLLVLDSVEQLGPVLARWLPWWLERAPGLKVLLTSRVKLELGVGELVRLSPLTDEAALELLVDRARAARPDFKARRWAPELKELVQALEGVPLALQLTGARLGSRTPKELLRGLSWRLLSFDGSAETSPARQQSLEHTVRWSWQQLEPWEQALMAQLSVMRGGFTPDAAEAVADLGWWPTAPWVPVILHGLYDKSMVRAEQGAGGQPRFQLYGPVRAFAAKVLETDDALKNPQGEGVTGERAVEDAERRHGRHYARFGYPASLRLLHAEGSLERRAAMALEWDNLCAVVERALERGDSDQAGRACLALHAVADRRGPLPQALRIVQRVLHQRDLRDPVRMELLRARALLLEAVGQADEAAADLAASLKLAQTLNDRRGVAEALRLEARRARKAGDHARSLNLCQQALAIAQALKDPAMQAEVLNSIGVLRMDMVGHREASQVLEHALKATREVGDRSLEAQVLSNLAVCDLILGQHDRAYRHQEQAVAIYRYEGGGSRLAFGLASLGDLHRSLGHLDKAEAHYAEALQELRELGERPMQPPLLARQGMVLELRGQHDASRDYFEQAVDLAEDYELGWERSATTAALGEWELTHGDLTEARKLLEQAHALARSHGAEHLRGQVLVLLARAVAPAGEQEWAGRLLDEAEQVLTREGFQSGLAKVHIGRGLVALVDGRTRDALRHYQRAQALATRLKAGPRSDLGRELQLLRSRLQG